MKSNNIVIMGPWLFVTAIWIGMIWVGQELEFFGVILLFILAFLGSAGLAALIHSKECCEGPQVDLTNELQSIHSTLDALTKDVVEIKKAIEE